MATNWQIKGEGTEEGTMGTPAQIGGSQWKADIFEARVVKAEIRTLVRKAIEQHCDVSMLGMMALKLGELDDLFNRLDEIGNNTKVK